MLQLSLDRVTHESRSELWRFFEDDDLPLPGTVVGRLRSWLGEGDEGGTIVVSYSNGRKAKLPSADLQATIDMLAQTERCWEEQETGWPFSVSLRLGLARMEDTLRMLLPRRERKDADDVDHVYSAAHVPHRVFTDIAPLGWLDPSPK